MPGQLELFRNTHNLACTAQAEIACMDNLDFMRGRSNGSMNLIVTSPPYNIGKSYESRISRQEYLEHQAKRIRESVRLLAPNGSLCWQVGNHVNKGEVYPLDILLYPLFMDHGLQFQDRIIWTFGHGLHCKKRFSGRHETILWFTKSGEFTFNVNTSSGENLSNVWDIPNVKFNHVEKTAHPCQFPVGLMERLVLALTNEGDNVLDPYLGVGSSAIAALKHGRNAYGCDLDENYVRIALERIRELRNGTLRTRPMDQPVLAPVHMPDDSFDHTLDLNF